MKITGSNKEPVSLSFERIVNWKETLELIFQLYFTRNIKTSTDLYKIEFCKMLDKFINNEQTEILGSGIKNGYSCVAKYFGEISGSDMIFVFEEKILLLHFGIND